MPEYIPGIFNYCDRWCERCAFTARCRVFADEQKYLAEMRDWDEFWSNLERAGCDVKSLKAEAELETTEVEAVSSKPRKKRKRRDPLLQAAEEYMDAAHAWLKAQPEMHRSPDIAAESGSVEEMFDVISWYHMQIVVKLSRACSQLRSAQKVQPWEEDEMQEFALEDANGSAKVALIGIERSLGAWTRLRNEFGRDEAAARKFIEQLARLRRAVDERLPDARAFHRPGFDD